MIIAWLTYEDLLIYERGLKAIAWTTQSTRENVQLILPLDNVIKQINHGDNGVELNIQKLIKN